MTYNILRRFLLIAGTFGALPQLACGFLRGEPAADHVDKARSLLARGDTVEAVRNFEHADLESYRDPSLYVVLGRLYRERGTIEGRLRSQRLLERAIQLFPGNPGLLLELGKTYFAQTFFPDAVRYFSDALERDNDLCEAHYYLALYHYNNWKRVNEFTDDLGRARLHFFNAVSCDPSSIPATVKYAFCLYALDHKKEAWAVCDDAVARMGEVAEFLMLRGSIAFDEERYEDAYEDLIRGRSLLDATVQRAYTDISALLPYDERSIYKAASNSKKEVLERTFWAELDPDPTTPVNERYLEHIYRMFLADLYFSLPRPPIHGWDTERGATFVKFGWPESINSTLGDSWMSGRVESWYYVSGNGVREFVFVDEYLNGNMRIPIGADSMVAVLRYESRVSNYQSDAILIPGEMDVTTFKDDDMSSSVYIAIRIDGDSLRSGVNLAEINHFYLRGSFFNESWLPEKDFADTLWTTDVPTESRNGRFCYNLIRDVSMPFDFYHLACAFQDELGLGYSLFRTYGDTYRYLGDGLVTSDVMLQTDPKPETARVKRRDKSLYPNPGHRYGRGQRLVVYFEIYNLHADNGWSDYNVSFSIYESSPDKTSRWRQLGRRVASFAGLAGDKEPFISQTIHRQGEGFESSEDLAINIDSLEEGRYELVVSVEDLISHKSAQSSVAFIKTTGPGE